MTEILNWNNPPKPTKNSDSEIDKNIREGRAELEASQKLPRKFLQ